MTDFTRPGTTPATGDNPPPGSPPSPGTPPPPGGGLGSGSTGASAVGAERAPSTGSQYSQDESSSSPPPETRSYPTPSPTSTSLGSEAGTTSVSEGLNRDRELRERTEERDVARRELEELRRRDDTKDYDSESLRREEYGGFKWGAAIFGWLVAIALTVLLASIIGAIAAAVGESLNFTQTDAERKAGEIGLATGIALLVVLMIAYFAGGYVAGRMSRYDGGRQGLGVWLIGLVVSAIAVGLGILFGREYDIFDRVNLPNLPIPTDTLTSGGLIALAAVLVGTLLAAFVGGKVGQRYHSRIDRITA